MKPILFSTPMVQALLNTKPDTWPAEPIDPSRPFKSQTRRVAEMPPAVQGCDYRYDGDSDGCHYLEQVVDGKPTEMYLDIGKAAYQEGDKFWVRETWRCMGFDDDGKRILVQYKDETSQWVDFDDAMRWKKFAVCSARWKSARHMPCEAARLFLEVKEVRMERLQDITEAGAWAEGEQSTCLKPGYRKCVLVGVDKRYTKECDCANATQNFAKLWNAINGKGAWESNPWVWVYEFMRAEG